MLEAGTPPNSPQLRPTLGRAIRRRHAHDAIRAQARATMDSALSGLSARSRESTGCPKQDPRILWSTGTRCLARAVWCRSQSLARPCRALACTRLPAASRFQPTQPNRLRINWKTPVEDATLLWIALTILAVVLAGIGGFWVGRSTSEDRKLIEELESELSRRMAELNHYKQSVHQHFDRSSQLFANMAGAYRDLYHHLADGCQALADEPTLARLEDHAGRLLAHVPRRDALPDREPQNARDDTRQRVTTSASETDSGARTRHVPPTDYDPRPDHNETEIPRQPRAD